MIGSQISRKALYFLRNSNLFPTKQISSEDEKRKYYKFSHSMSTESELSKTDEDEHQVKWKYIFPLYLLLFTSCNVDVRWKNGFPFVSSNFKLQYSRQAFSFPCQAQFDVMLQNMARSEKDRLNSIYIGNFFCIQSIVKELWCVVVNWKTLLSFLDVKFIWIWVSYDIISSLKAA